MTNFNYKDVIYALLCLAFSLIAGAALFEHSAVWPNAYAAPPASLSMFQGEYGLRAANFWQFIHPVVMVLFIVVLVLTWKTPRRKHVWIGFGGYILAMITTALYFVPELIAITGTEFSATTDPDLQTRGAMWINLSLIRMLLIMCLALVLYLGLKKRGERVRPV